MRLATLCALIVPASLASQSSQVVTMPFEYEDVRVYVPVRVGALPMQWFILDTGAQPTILTSELASLLPNAVGDTGTITGVGTGRLSQGWAEHVHLSVGGVSLAPRRTAVSPLDSLLSPFTGRHAPGIIGSQFFLEHVIALDFRDRRIRVHPSAGYRYAGRGAQIPMRLSGGVPIADGVLTTRDGRRLPMRLLVDLGAKATLLVSEPFIARYHLRDSLTSAVRSSLGAGVGGETRYDFTRMPRLEIGGARGVAADNIIAGLSAEGTIRSIGFDALLGAEFLERYNVIFDYARERIILEPLLPAPLPAEFDMSGAFFVASTPTLRRFTVHRVIPDSPAADVGLRPGDVLRSAAGRSADTYTLSALRQLLRSEEGREVVLEVERGDSLRTVTLRLRRLIA
jgi:hypothetical protein